MKRTNYFIAALAAMIFTVSSSAAIVTFDLAYSGSVNGNAATGTGVISFDDTILPNIAIGLFDVSAGTLGITSFSITIAGASSGNGTFDLTDIDSGWVWTLGGPIDLSAELVGQANFSDFNWLCDINSLPCSNPLAPQGVGPFVIEADGGELLNLMSMTPRPVPVPAALWLLGSALAGLGVMRRGKSA